MEDFKEFQGKSLDEAIKSACAYFDTPREKLEIDIVQDAKNGIFGLVGARKALVRARRAHLRPAVAPLMGRADASPAPSAHNDNEEAEKRGRTSRNARRPGRERCERNELGELAETTERPERRERTEQAEKVERAERAEKTERPDNRGNRAPRPERTERGERPERAERIERAERVGERTERAESRPEARRDEGRTGTRRQRSWQASTPKPTTDPLTGQLPEDLISSVLPTSMAEQDGPAQAPRQTPPFNKAMAPESDQLLEQPLDHDDAAEGFPDVPFESLDKAMLEATGRKVALGLVTPILGEVDITINLGENRLEVHVECGDDSGLLIGREGQTLAALQYLASRLVSREMNAPVRVQFDVGDYRERQDERLRELAWALAERVRETGRSCSTRPMSSYHRRIIHMTLQDETDVQTRSSGDGSLKRVVVQRRRADKRSPREE